MSSAEQIINVVDHYKRKMERHPGEPDILLHALTKLERLSGVSISVLQSTGIGKAVNGLKKAADEAVATKAKEIVAKWKEIVANEEEAEELEQQRMREQNGDGNHSDREDSGLANSDGEGLMGEDEDVPDPVREEEEQQQEEEKEPPRKRHKHERGEREEPTKSKPSGQQRKSSKSRDRDRDREQSSSSSSSRKESRDRDRPSASASSSSSSSSKKEKKDRDRDRERSKSSSSSSRHRSSSSKSGSSKSDKKSSSSKLSTSSAFDQALANPEDDDDGAGSSKGKFPAMPSVPSGLSTHYKPLPPRKRDYGEMNGSANGANSRAKALLIQQSDDEALSSLIAMRNKNKSSRTMVYSGAKRSGFLDKVPTLQEACILVLQEHVDDIEEVGDLPFYILEPVLSRASPQTLSRIEECNPRLMEDTGSLWERFVQKNFPKAAREEMETYRDMFDRCTMEREEKLNRLKVKVKDSYKREETSSRKAKLAYVGTVAKPPRNMARAQSRFGTGLPVGHALGKGNVPHRPVPAPAPSIRGAGAGQNKPKVAPMMAKAMRLMKGLKGGFRR